MKTLKELNIFYESKLKSTILEFEERRIKIRNRFLFFTFLIIWNAITIYFLLIFDNSIVFESFPLFFFLISVILTFLYKYMSKDFIKDFKEKVIKPLIKNLDSNLHYMPNLHISKELFNKSTLFERPDKFNGNDYVIGKIKAIKIEFSDIKAQKEYRDSKGKKRYSTIFQGSYIVVDFNKNISSKTVVLPDIAQNSFGDLIGNWLQSNNLSRDELVKMDNLTFEKEFVVYSTDQIEARYILTPNFMERILDFKNKFEENLYLSFIENKIHIAIEHKKDMFEPTLFKSLLNDNLNDEYLDKLYLITSLIEELKLSN